LNAAQQGGYVVVESEGGSHASKHSSDDVLMSIAVVRTEARQDGRREEK